MGVPHDHLKRPVPEQFCHRPQIYPRHYESTCKGVAVAMPGVPLDLRLFERAGKPAARSLERLAGSDRRADRHCFHSLGSTVQFLEGGDCDRVERDRSWVSVLGFGKMDLPAPEVDLAPIAVTRPSGRYALDVNSGSQNAPIKPVFLSRLSAR
jgi:hypothetical protein